MSIESHICQSPSMIIRTVSGPLTPEHVAEAIDNAQQMDGFRPDLPVIWNLCEADISAIHSHELHQLIQIIANASEKRGRKYPIALVADSDLNFGISMMFQGYAAELAMNIEVFRDLSKANEWIKSLE